MSSTSDAMFDAEVKMAELTAPSYGNILFPFEKFIKDFFGSEEAIREYAPLFIIETSDPIFTPSAGEGTTLYFKCEIEHRIRLRTPLELELAAAQAEAMEKHFG